MVGRLSKLVCVGGGVWVCSVWRGWFLTVREEIYRHGQREGQKESSGEFK